MCKANPDQKKRVEAGVVDPSDPTAELAKRRWWLMMKIWSIRRSRRRWSCVEHQDLVQDHSEGLAWLVFPKMKMKCKMMEKKTTVLPMEPHKIYTFNWDAKDAQEAAIASATSEGAYALTGLYVCRLREAISWTRSRRQDPILYIWTCSRRPPREWLRTTSEMR